MHKSADKHSMLRLLFVHYVTHLVKLQKYTAILC